MITQLFGIPIIGFDLYMCCVHTYMHSYISVTPLSTSMGCCCCDII